MIGADESAILGYLNHAGGILFGPATVPAGGRRKSACLLQDKALTQNLFRESWTPLSFWTQTSPNKHTGQLVRLRPGVRQSNLGFFVDLSGVKGLSPSLGIGQ